MIVQHTYKIIIDQLGKCNVPFLNANISTFQTTILMYGVYAVTIPIQAYLLRRFGKVL